MQEMPINSNSPIGIFDSGVGGLSVLGAIRYKLPRQAIIYIGDQAHVPYGVRQKADVQAFSEGITRFLLGKGVKLI
ncbi:MAG: glutamate racemase, partial [Chloroflexota bacterium]